MKLKILHPLILMQVVSLFLSLSPQSFLFEYYATTTKVSGLNVYTHIYLFYSYVQKCELFCYLHGKGKNLKLFCGLFSRVFILCHTYSLFCVLHKMFMSSLPLFNANPFTECYDIFKRRRRCHKKWLKNCKTFSLHSKCMSRGNYGEKNLGIGDKWNGNLFKKCWQSK